MEREKSESLQSEAKYLRAALNNRNFEGRKKMTEPQKDNNMGKWRALAEDIISKSKELGASCLQNDILGTGLSQKITLQRSAHDERVVLMRKVRCEVEADANRFLHSPTRSTIVSIATSYHELVKLSEDMGLEDIASALEDTSVLAEQFAEYATEVAQSTRMLCILCENQ